MNIFISFNSKQLYSRLTIHYSPMILGMISAYYRLYSMTYNYAQQRKLCFVSEYIKRKLVYHVWRRKTFSIPPYHTLINVFILHVIPFIDRKHNLLSLNCLSFQRLRCFSMTKQFLLQKWHFRWNVTNSNFFGVVHVVLTDQKIMLLLPTINIVLMLIFMNVCNNKSGRPRGVQRVQIHP